MKKAAIKATTGLAGAVAIAGGSQAYGAIVAIPAPATLAATATATPNVESVDVNGDGDADLVFADGIATESSGTLLAYSGVTAYSGGVVGYVLDGAYYYATKLAKGATIGSTSTLVQGSYLNTLEVRYKGKNYGQFTTKGYIGFSFTETDGTHYGYLGVTSTETGSTAANIKATLTFTGGAYDTVPGESITIPGAVPEPGSLAALAFGALGTAGVAAYRRNRAATAVA